MTKRPNEREKESLCREAGLVKINDIINGDLKMNCNKHSHQLKVYLTLKHQINASQQI